VTHELFLDIEPISVKCIPTVLQSVGRKQCEVNVGGVGLQLLGDCAGAPRAALSCVVEEDLVSASLCGWCSRHSVHKTLLSLKHQGNNLSMHEPNSTMS
jgi:hypothetical protein